MHAALAQQHRQLHELVHIPAGARALLTLAAVLRALTVRSCAATMSTDWMLMLPRLDRLMNSRPITLTTAVKGAPADTWRSRAAGRRLSARGVELGAGGNTRPFAVTTAVAGRQGVT